MSEPRMGDSGDVAGAHHLLPDTGSMAVALGALTPREFDCLRLASQGKSHKTIAAELGIVAGTVSSYLRDAKVKLGARSPRHAAMMYASYVYRPPKTGGSDQGIDPPSQITTSATPVEITEVNDALLDRGTVESVATTWSKILREILDGG